MNMRNIYTKVSACLAAAALLLGAAGCNKYLNVVPDDGVATMESAFNLRTTAIRYLSTCYAYMTNDGDVASDPGILSGDELWDLISRNVSNQTSRVPRTMFQIARGLNSAQNVYGNDWANMYKGIRCCDILVENIDLVPDMETWEKEQWKAEATFLKAYYHFNLVRKWGPVPIIRESLPMDSDVETVRVYRDNIDDCFDFILELLDKAMPNLPLVNPSDSELGRVTQAICASFKARVAVYAASPLFNGNAEEASLVDNRGVQLFPDKTEAEKIARWTYAVKACKDAIDVCDKANYFLFDTVWVHRNYRMCDSLAMNMALRGAFNQRWNSEVIWGNTQTSYSSITAFQQWCMPNFSEFSHSTAGYQFIGVPLKIADQFYTEHGLPINFDKSWSGVDPMELKRGDPAHKYYIEEGYETVRMNFNREPRYYSSLGFDGGTWLGAMSQFNDVKPSDLNVLKCRIGGKQAKTGNETGPITGFFPKKMFPYRCIITNTNSFTGYWYAYPIIRLTDLYLLYAEAINEAEGPDGPNSKDLYKYLNAIRSRAGIPDVKTSWDEFSNNPGYYGTKVGMRAIIQQERLNEFAFEGQRFWDIRRWKTAPAEYQKKIYGFNVTGSTAAAYYQKELIAEQPFGLKDYFWPIAISYIEVNPNLVQNIGW